MKHRFLFLFFVVIAIVAVNSSTKNRLWTFPAANYNAPQAIHVWSQNRKVLSFSISFDTSAIRSDSYGNFFQTGPDPNGLRLELQPKRLLLIQGSRTFSGAFAWKSSGWHHFVISGDMKSGSVNVNIDGRQAIKGQFPVHIAPFDFSDVAAGCGMGLARCLDGSIRNFVFSEYSPSYVFSIYTFVSVVSMLGLGYASLFVWSRKQRPIIWKKWNSLTNPAVVALILMLFAWWSIRSGVFPVEVGRGAPLASFLAFIVAAIFLARVDRLPLKMWAPLFFMGLFLIGIVVLAGSWWDGAVPSIGPASVARWLYGLGVPILVAMWIPLVFPEPTSKFRIGLATAVVGLGMLAVCICALALFLAGTVDSLCLSLALLLFARVPD